MFYYDYIVVGSGLAGLYCAHKASKTGKVLLLTKSGIKESNSFYAQGGIASVTHSQDDTSMHFDDTITAGAGLCEPAMVDILVKEGPSRIKELIDEGMKFDTENGSLALGLEGGHHFKRILHSGGDATGRRVVEFMISKVLDSPNIKIAEGLSLIELHVNHGRVEGVRCWNEKLNREESFFGASTFLTTGGASAIYKRTTNPSTTIGDGLIASYYAGAALADLEFIQFHPTALYVRGESSAFLISEAVRGEGAHLLSKSGERFMVDKHPLAELAPRDIVAREIFKTMREDDNPFVTLSLSHIDRGSLIKRFPTISSKCAELGYDFTKAIPVAPAAHYTIGGVVTDENGEASLKSLFICGELASTGVMGANRLASNSLLECLVFAHRSIEYCVCENKFKDYSKDNIPQSSLDYINGDGSIIKFVNDSSLEKEYNRVKEELSGIMMSYASIVRNQDELRRAIDSIERIQSSAELISNGYFSHRIEGLLLLCRLIVESALFRRESIGAHYRSDFPGRSGDYKHTIVRNNREIYSVEVGLLKDVNKQK